MISKRSIFLFVFLLVFIFVLSCASAPKTKASREVLSPDMQVKQFEASIQGKGMQEKEMQVKGMNERILMHSVDSRVNASRDYQIGPEDLLEITVFEEEKLNKAVRVSTEGKISLPLIGVLKVKGCTADEVEREIAKLLSERYLQDPQVSVFIREYRNQRMSVIGAVEKPGTYDVAGQKTILDLLSMAGGLKEDSGHLLFLVRRPKPAEETQRGEKDKNSDAKMPKTFVIDLEELLFKNDLSLNLTLMHGDVINVPVSGKIFVGGEVTKPGGFPLKGKRITVTQAISMAEGLKWGANGSETKIFRTSKNSGEREIVSLNVDKILKGESEDPPLLENDILIVANTGVRNFFIGLRDTFKGLIGFGLSMGAF